jgi:hypothetical protein
MDGEEIRRGEDGGGEIRRGERRWKIILVWSMESEVGMREYGGMGREPKSHVKPKEFRD